MYQITSFDTGEIELHRSCVFFRLRTPAARPFDTPAVPKNPSAIRLVSPWIYGPEILNSSCPHTDEDVEKVTGTEVMIVAVSV